MSLRNLTRIGVVSAAVAALGTAPAAASSSGGTTAIDPHNFVRSITNPYLPYRPGTCMSTPGSRTVRPSGTSSGSRAARERSSA